MAEVRIVGNDGAINIGTTHNAIFNSWTMTLDQGGIIDLTGFGDSWRSKRGNGLHGASFSATGHASSGAAGTEIQLGADSTATATITPAAAGESVTLTVNTGCTYVGTGIISEGVVSVDQSGESTVSYSGEFDGAVTETWSVS